MPDHDALIRREFSRQAESMGNAALFNDAGVLARIREAAQITASTRVLDVACGPDRDVCALNCAVLGCGMQLVDYIDGCAAI